MKFNTHTEAVGEVTRRGAFFLAGGMPFGPRVVFDPNAAEGQGEGTGTTDDADDDVDKGVEGGDKGKGGGEGGDKPKPSDAEARLLREQMKTKEKLRAATAALDEARANLARFEGIDPDAVRQLLDKEREAERTQLEAKGEFDRLKQMMADDHKRREEGLAAQIAELSQKLQASSQTIENLTVGAAFSQSTYVANDLVLTPAKARTIYGTHFDIEDGEVVGYDKPRGAQGRTKLVNSAGDALSFEDAIRKLVEIDPERDRLLRSKLAPGAQSNTGQEKVREKQDEVTGLARISAAISVGGIPRAKGGPKLK